MIQLYNLEGDALEQIPDGSPIPSGRWTTPGGGAQWQRGGLAVTPAPVATPAPGPGSGYPQPLNSPLLAAASAWTQANLPSVPPPATVTPTAPMTSPLFDPTHRLVGTDAAGNSVYRLIDEAGVVIQWRMSPSGAQVGAFQNLGPAESVAPFTSVAPTYTVNVPPPSLAPAPVVPATPTTTRSPYFDPTHRPVGYDALGNIVYRIVDEAGIVIQFRNVNGQPIYENMGPVQSAPPYVSPPRAGSIQAPGAPLAPAPQGPAAATEQAALTRLALMAAAYLVFK